MIKRIIKKGPIKPENIVIKKYKRSQRKIDILLEKQIEKKWDEKVKEAKEKRQQIWDNKLYRLDSCREKASNVIMNVSLVNYSILRSLALLREKLENYSEDYYSKALNVASLIITSDNKYILGVKSSKMQYLDKIDVVGGTAEYGDILETGYDLLTVANKEMYEEINVQISAIKKQSILGIILTAYSNVIVILETILGIDVEAVRKLFDKRSEEEFEDLVIVDKDKLQEYLNMLDGKFPLIAELIT